MLRLLAPRPAVLCHRCRLSAVAAAAAAAAATAPPTRQQQHQRPQLLLQPLHRRHYASISSSSSLVNSLRAWITDGPEAATAAAAEAASAATTTTTAAASLPGAADAAAAAGSHQSFFVQDAPAALQDLLESDSAVSVAGELLAAGCEPTFASLGLGTGLWPSSMSLKLLETMHATLGMPWWLSAILLGVGVRLVLLLPSMQLQLMMRTALPKVRILSDVKEQLRFASRSGNTLECLRLQQLVLEKLPDMMSPAKMRQFMIRNLATTVGFAFAMTFVQLGSIRGLYRATSLPVESFQQGGILWLTDLTTIDPYFLLPAAITGLLVLNITYYFKNSAVSIEQLTMVKPLAFTLLPVFVFTCMLNFPGANLCYFLATGCTAQLLNRINNSEAGKDFWKARIGLPRIEEVPPPPSPQASLGAERIRTEFLPTMNNRDYQTTRMPDRPGDVEVPKTYRIRRGQLPQQHKKISGV